MTFLVRSYFLIRIVVTITKAIRWVDLISNITSKRHTIFPKWRINKERVGMPKNVIEHVFDHGFIHIKILARKVIFFVQHFILFCVLSRRGGLLKFIFMQISPNLPGGLTNPPTDLLVFRPNSYESET